MAYDSETPAISNYSCGWTPNPTGLAIPCLPEPWDWPDLLAAPSFVNPTAPHHLAASPVPPRPARPPLRPCTDRLPIDGCRHWLCRRTGLRVNTAYCDEVCEVE